MWLRSRDVGRATPAQSLESLIAFLQTPAGLEALRRAQRENLRYKVERYSALAAEADEEVTRERDLVRLKRPALKQVSGVEGDEHNWDIFEKIGQAYLDAKDRASAFDNVRQRAERRLFLVDEAAERQRDGLVTALRALSTFASQAHIVSTVVDIVSGFLKNPRLIRSKFLNFIMVGAAGTGKTTLAGIIARAFARAGMFVDERVVDAGRGEFVGEYEGQTVARTRSFLVSNLDRGVVFVDEAYALTPWSDGKPEGYGSEAVSAMVEFMTRYKGLYCLLAAGYEREMTRYFLPTNPGLPRRFPYRFVLHDLTPEELLQVFQRALLIEQGIEVPAGYVEVLDSECYFSDDAWGYLRRLVAVCTAGSTAYEPEQYDRATRQTYRMVHTFVPRFPLLHRLFENQAGSMTNLAEEAVVVLMRAVPYASRDFARRQPRAVMREIVVRRILNSALSDAPACLAELKCAEEEALP